MPLLAVSAIGEDRPGIMAAILRRALSPRFVPGRAAAAAFRGRQRHPARVERVG
jgi:hypothetical protein